MSAIYNIMWIQSASYRIVGALLYVAHRYIQELGWLSNKQKRKSEMLGLKIYILFPHFGAALLILLGIM